MAVATAFALLGPAATAAPGEPRIAGPAAVQGDDLVDAALIASGYEGRARRRRARADLERLLMAAVGQAQRAKGERARAATLLGALHAKGSLLGTYDARATTLRDVLERRRYNCVSASVLYNLAARRLELTVGAELLPTHARSMLSVAEAGRLSRVVVETTSPNGFDPDPATLRRILGQVAAPTPDGARAIVSSTGEIVDTRVLIGTIYVNRASIAQEGGDFTQAQRLFALGQRFATSAHMKRVLRDQRAALLAQLAADDVLSEDPALYARAYKTLSAAVKLRPRDETVRQAVFQNLRAAAERLIAARAERGDEPGLVKLAGEAAASGLSFSDRAGLRAFALSEVARLRIEQGDYDGAIEAIELALREQLGPKDEDLRSILEANRVAAFRLAALTLAKAGALDKSRPYLERIARRPGLTAAQRAQLDTDRLRVIHLVGNHRIDALDYAGAAAVYREGLRRFPKDETCRHNLVAVLERLVGPHVEAARCADARPLLQEIELIEPGSKYARQARVRCLVARAKARLDADDPGEAVSLLREARRQQVEVKGLDDALAVAYARWIGALVAKSSCKPAKSQAKAFIRFGHPRWSAGRVNKLLGSCAR